MMTASPSCVMRASLCLPRASATAAHAFPIVAEAIGEAEGSSDAVAGAAASGGAIGDAVGPASPLFVDGVWTVTSADIDRLGIGAALLGSGGGGSTRLAMMKAKAQLAAEPGSIRIVHPAYVADDDYVVASGYMGAPSVIVERLPSGLELPGAIRALSAHMASKHHGRVTALQLAEVGGLNALEPLVAAAGLGLPVVDADCMGRAFPELNMTCYSWDAVGGAGAYDAAIAGVDGVATVAEAASTAETEVLFRSKLVPMGCVAGIALLPASGRTLRAHGVLGSLSAAWRLGNAVQQALRPSAGSVGRDAASLGERAVSSLRALQPRVREVCRGKITGVTRNVVGGFTKGTVCIADLAGAAGAAPWTVDFCNEFLGVWEEASPRKLVVAAPDIIAVMDAQTARVYQSEEVRYGLQVVVVGIPAPAHLRSHAALAVVGPQVFGYDAAEAAAVAL